MVGLERRGTPAPLVEDVIVVGEAVFSDPESDRRRPPTGAAGSRRCRDTPMLGIAFAGGVTSTGRRRHAAARRARRVATR